MIMNVEESKRIISEDYINILVEYLRDDNFMRELEGYPRNIIDTKYGVIYAPKSLLRIPLRGENGYSVIPKVYGLMQDENLSEMGVETVQNLPDYATRGEGVLLGFVDTGIDYTHPAFKTADGNTRIVSIWDQTIPNDNPQEKTFYYGTEFTQDQINQALLNEDPFLVVPSRDEIGHGTMLAGITGGSQNSNNKFRGVVPLAEFAIVKLKPAKTNIRDYFFIPEDVPCYQQDDIMFGIQYLITLARSLNRPIAICIGLGTNQGNHDGTDILEDYLSYSGTHVGRAYIIAAGNEGNSRHHYYGVIDQTVGYNEVELVVEGNDRGFSMELWGFEPNTYSVDIMSPSGQYIPQIVGRLGESRELSFLFENTILNVDHLIIESQSGAPFILIRFRNPAPGSWKFRVYARGSEEMAFHMWLPITGFISPGTHFNNADPYTTVTSPGNAMRNSTVTAYDAVTRGIYINASRGFSKPGYVVPSFAAPGVGALAPVPGNGYGNFSGTSISAAYVTGLAAMIFEWGIIKGNYQTLSSRQIESFLRRGVKTDPSQSYPNRTWGYGMVNIYNTFSSLQQA